MKKIVPLISSGIAGPLGVLHLPRLWQKVLLEACGVSAGYGRQPPAIVDVELKLHGGEVIAVLGPNGAGKSTLVKTLTGVLEPQHGEVRLLGADIRRVGRREVARRIAVVPQDVHVAFDFRVRDVVMMGRAPHQGSMMLACSSDRAIVQSMLERTDLVDLAERNVRELSGGEQMRVAIARALAQQPEILVLDEATAHLDIRHSVTIHALVRREVRERNLGCIVVLHDLNEAAQNADQVLVLQNGRVKAKGPVPQVMTYRVLRETFGVDLYVGVNELDGTRYFIPIREHQAG